MCVSRTVAAFLILTGGAIAQVAQPGARPEDAKPQFEVASIKPSSPDARGTSVRPVGNGISIGNMTLKELIVLAYRVQPFQVSGGPAWFDSVHYDITAKSEKAPKLDDIPLMLQALLADRFQLALHHESKELPIYAVVLARKDGKLGPNLTESKPGSCTPIDPTKPPPPPKPGEPPLPGCGGMMTGLDRLRAVGTPISGLESLSRILGRTVIDKTGLTGTYDMKAEWTLDDNQLANITPPGAPRSTSPDNAGPSIFTAFQEQLGLKLESQKGPVEVLVIDRAEKPSEN
jgi:uncharacterized protein (TIGR03435 family)